MVNSSSLLNKSILYRKTRGWIKMFGYTSTLQQKFAALVFAAVVGEFHLWGWVRCYSSKKDFAVIEQILSYNDSPI